jgi:hypothetical protein
VARVLFGEEEDDKGERRLGGMFEHEHEHERHKRVKIRRWGIVREKREREMRRGGIERWQ